MKSEDIARIAGVSRGTVSRVLNGKSDVAAATREKIEKIIEEYGYTPNVSARKLAGKPVEIIGFFVSNISEYRERSDYTIKWWSYESPYFMRIMTSFLTEAKKRGYNLLIDIIDTEEELNTIETYFKSGIISGAVFVNFNEKVSTIDKCIEKGYKVALVDQKMGDSNLKNAIYVNTDDESGGYLATCHLIEKGHKKIAHIHGTKKVLSAKLRIKGYKKALKDHGIELNKNYLVDGKYNEYATYIATKELLEKNKDDLPTAIFFANDVMAVGGIKAIKEAGLRVKDDISIMGFDNYSFGEIFDMSFSTVNAPLEKMSEFAAENLISAIKNEEHLNVYKGKVELVDRGSIKEL